MNWIIDRDPRRMVVRQYPAEFPEMALEWSVIDLREMLRLTFAEADAQWQRACRLAEAIERIESACRLAEAIERMADD